MLHHGSCLDHRAAHDHSILHFRSGFHLNAGKKDGVLYMAVHTAAVGDHRIFHQTLISDLMTGHTAVAAVYLPVFIKQIDAAVLRVQDLHVGQMCIRDRTKAVLISLISRSRSIT